MDSYNMNIHVITIKKENSAKTLEVPCVLTQSQCSMISKQYSFFPILNCT